MAAGVQENGINYISWAVGSLVVIILIFGILHYFDII